QLRIRLVGIRAVVELRYILGGGHEALNTLLGALDLLYLLCNGRAGIKQSESYKRGEQPTQKASTRGHHIPVSNERHGMALHLDRSFAHQPPKVSQGAGTCPDAHGKSGARHDQLSFPARVCISQIENSPG